MSVEHEHSHDAMDATETSTTPVSVYTHPPPFIPDQRVLCSDVNNADHYYEAIIRRVKCVSEEEWSFYVHYQGWNSRWDRWVSEKELLQDTPENRKTYIKAREPAKKRKNETSTTAGRKRKAASNSKLNNNNRSSGKAYEEYCELPFTLLTVIVDESDYITRKGFDSPNHHDSDLNARPARSVHHLPAEITVKQVLQQYKKKRGGKKEPDETKRENVARFCEGLALLFDDMLPAALLYPQEVPQYESLSKIESLKDKRPCEIYGCEFLLRLFLRLPFFLGGEPKSEMDVHGPMLADLIVLLQKNRQACFKNSYREPNYNELTEWEKKLADDEELSKRKVPTDEQQQRQRQQQQSTMAIGPTHKKDRQD